MEGDGLDQEQDLDEIMAEIMTLCNKLEAGLTALLIATSAQPAPSDSMPHDGLQMRDNADLVLRGPDGEIKEVRHAN